MKIIISSKSRRQYNLFLLAMQGFIPIFYSISKTTLRVLSRHFNFNICCKLIIIVERNH